MIIETMPVGPMGVNCTIIGCSETKDAAVVDPGAEPDRILDVVLKHELKLSKILITHGHVDHITAVCRLQEVTGAETYMHPADAFFLEHAQMQAPMFGLPDPGNPAIDHDIGEGDIISIGDLNVSVLHTPGHSSGSVTFSIDKHLLVGDLLFQGSIGRTDLPGGDYDMLIQSVNDKIFSQPGENIVYPGHGPLTSIGNEKAMNPYFR